MLVVNYKGIIDVLIPCHCTATITLRKNINDQPWLPSNTQILNSTTESCLLTVFISWS